jgi:hypothetical protein
MNNYYELNYETNYNPKLLSAKISCKNMSYLASIYTKQQNNLFVDKIDMDLCDYHNNLNKNIGDFKAKESNLLNGHSINKMSCIYKRPEYNDGPWKEQYQSSDTFKNNIHNYKLFDYQTRNKTKVIQRN